jgi:signal transduction histidine kinase
MKWQDNEMQEATEFLPLAKQASSNARLLLDDLLLWARNQFEKVYFQPELLSLQQMIESIFDLLKPQADAKRLQLIANCPPDLLLEADEQMLKVILRNLLSNAIKFSFPDNEVRIEVRIKEQAVEISVSDQGVGISEQNLAKLFNRYYHVSTRGTQGEKGSGLGLDLCRDFVEKHGGQITVRSKVNQGSTFIVLLPLLVKLNRAG